VCENVDEYKRREEERVREGRRGGKREREREKEKENNVFQVGFVS